MSDSKSFQETRHKIVVVKPNYSSKKISSLVSASFIVLINRKI